MKLRNALTLSALTVSISLAAQVASAGLACAMTFQDGSASETSSIEGSKDLSQLIRSNAAHYWKYVANSKEASGLRLYEAHRGLVAGDPHLGNFSVIPLTDKNGQRKMQEVNIDFDDAGIGPFAYDFARFVITVKAIDEEMKVKALMEAYILGLKGGETTPPELVSSFLGMPIQSYDRLEAEYVDKKTKKGYFKLKEGELEEYDGSLTRGEIEALFPNERILDIATRPRERGGSAEAERIWIYAERKDGVQKIYELKGHTPTSMNNYSHQADAVELVSAVRDAFWPNIANENYRLLKVGSKNKLFWLRDKKVTLFDIPYNMNKPANKQFISEYSLYVASKLGQAHGRQTTSAAYLAAIQKDPDMFREGVKRITKEYIKLASETLGE